jgi:hypothetical protein
MQNVLSVYLFQQVCHLHTCRRLAEQCNVTFPTSWHNVRTLDSLIGLFIQLETKADALYTLSNGFHLAEVVRWHRLSIPD